MISRAPSHESQHIDANFTRSYRSSAARSLSSSSAEGQLVHRVVQKSAFRTKHEARRRAEVFVGAREMDVGDWVLLVIHVGDSRPGVQLALRATDVVFPPWRVIGRVTANDPNSPMTAFCPENAALMAVNSALPRLIRGRSGRLGVDAVMVYAGLGSPKEVCTTNTYCLRYSLPYHCYCVIARLLYRRGE